jgi:hypothetical protein
MNKDDGFILVQRKHNKGPVQNVPVFAITFPINSDEYRANRSYDEANRKTLLYETIMKYANPKVGTTFNSFFSDQNNDVKYFFSVDSVVDDKTFRTIILKQWCLHTDKRRPDGLKPFNQRFVKVVRRIWFL